MSSLHVSLRESERVRERMEHENVQLENALKGLQHQLDDKSFEQKDILTQLGEVELEARTKAQHSAEVERECKLLQHRLEESQQSIESLQNELKRLQEKKREEEEGKERINATPLHSSSSSSLSGSHRKSLINRTSMVSASPDQLYLKLSSSEHKVMDLQTELEGLQRMFDHKSRRLEEVSTEYSKVKEEMESLKLLMDQTRSKDIVSEASLQVQLLERERSIEALKSQISQLEEQLEESKTMLQGSQVELLSERDVTHWLRDMITKIESQAALQIGQGSEELTRQIEDLECQLGIKTAMMEDLERAKREVEGKFLSNMEEKVFLEHSNERLSTELKEVRFQLETSDTDVYVRMNQLNVAMEDVQREKASLEVQLCEKQILVANLEAEMRRLSALYAEDRNSFNGIVNKMRVFNAELLGSETNLRERVEEWSNLVHSRLDVALERLSVSQKTLYEQRKHDEDIILQLQEAVEESNRALQSALHRNAQIEEDKEELIQQMESALGDKTALEKLLEDTQRVLNESEDLVRSREENVGVEDFARLVDRLEQSEARAQEVISFLLL